MEELNSRPFYNLTSLIKSNTCPRAFFYQAVGLETPDKFGALKFGTAIHECLPLVESGSIQNARDRFIEIFGDTVGAGYRTLDTAEELFVAYQRRIIHPGFYNWIHPKDFGIDTTADWEVPFSILLPYSRKSRTLSGMVDGIVERDGQYWVLEIKTTAQAGDLLSMNLADSPQVLGYTIVMKEMLGLDIQGTITLVCKVAKNPEIIPFQTILTEQKERMFNEWLEETIRRIEDYEDQQNFPRMLAGCSSYPQFYKPGYPCSFYSLCHFTDDWRKISTEYQRGDYRKKVCQVTIGRTSYLDS